MATVVIPLPTLVAKSKSLTLFTLTEKAAGAWGHDGPFIIPAEANPENQQI